MFFSGHDVFTLLIRLKQCTLKLTLQYFYLNRNKLTEFIKNMRYFSVVSSENFIRIAAAIIALL